MPAVRRVGIYGPTKIDGGAWELRWRLYIGSRTTPLERRRAFRGTGARARADVFRKRLEHATDGVVEHGERWVFNDDYEPLTRSGVSQLVTTLTAQAGVEKGVYPHLLRHSYATWARGMNPVQLAQILGHSSLAMIMNVYAHLSPQDAHAAMMRLFLTNEDDDQR